MTRILLAGILALLLVPSPTPDYSIQAIRYAISPDVPISELVAGGPSDKIDVAMVVWPFAAEATPSSSTVAFIAKHFSRNFQCGTTCGPTKR